MSVAAGPVRFNPFGADFRTDPYPHYHRLRDSRPVHRTLGMWVLTRHADVRQVLRDRTFSAGLIPELVARRVRELPPDRAARIERLGRKSLVFTDNPDHARLRALVNRVFTAQAVEGLTPLVTEVAQRLAPRPGSLDVIADFAAPLPVTALSEWMGLPADVREQVGPWTHAIRFLLEPGLMTGADVRTVGEVVESFAAALGEVVAQRRRDPGGDLISRLLAARTGGGDRLSDEELVFVCVMCFVAGVETTKSLIGNAVLALLRHPDQAALLRARPALVRDAVDEALRYDSPLQMTKRVATTSTEIGGTRIAPGDQVLLCLGAANRDPAVFAEPDTFDLTRDAGAHLAFGHGMHGCLGGMLAQLQARIALPVLSDVELATDRLEWQDHSVLVRGLKHLPVTVRGAR